MHREDNQEIGQFHCEVCSSVLKTKDYLGRHMRKVHAGYWFMCSMCEQMFKTKEHLKEHEKHHTGENSTTNVMFVDLSSREKVTYKGPWKFIIIQVLGNVKNVSIIFQMSDRPYTAYWTKS